MKILILIALIACIQAEDDQNLCGERIDPSKHQFADDPSNCENYLWCNYDSDDELVSVHQAECPTGFKYNPTEMACDGNGECEDTCHFIKDEETVLVADASDTTCRTYLQCKGKVVQPDEFEPCEAPSVFNRNFGVCTIESIAPCTGSSGGGGGTVRCGADDEGFIDEPTSCTDFIFCSNGVGTRRTCPNDLHFNPKGLFCDRPENLNPPCTIGQSKVPQNIPLPPLINVEAAKRKALLRGIKLNL